VYVSRLAPPQRMPDGYDSTAHERGRASGRIRVEAVTWYPWKESHLWVTTKDHLDRVLEQVVAGLEAGEVARPLGAEFRGSQEMIAETYRGLRRDEETGYRL